MMVDEVAPVIRALDVKTPRSTRKWASCRAATSRRWSCRAGSRRTAALILDEPTRAVDVGAKAEIYRLIDRLAREGMAIMLISSEMPELLALSDRIVVMSGGRLSPFIEKRDATEEVILSHALGQEWRVTLRVPGEVRR
jgi:L-arabinose transport system ATP-binding protein